MPRTAQFEIIDIAAVLKNARHYNADTDPAKFQSKKTGRGPLRPG